MRTIRTLRAIARGIVSVWRRLTFGVPGPTPDPVNDVVARFDPNVAALELAGRERMKHAQQTTHSKPVRPVGRIA